MKEKYLYIYILYLFVVYPDFIEYGHVAKPSILGLQIVFLAARRIIVVVVIIIVRARNYNSNYYRARQKI